MATTVSPPDEVIADLCSQIECRVYRGPIEDISVRLLKAAEGADVIVQITGDCPLIDPAHIDQTVKILVDRGADFASNSLSERTFPLGCDVRAFTMAALKRSIALSIMYGALDLVEERAKRHPMEIMELALRNVQPTVEVKPRRVGGSTYQVPVEVPSDRGVSLAMRWILQNARKRGGRNMVEKLAGELMEAANGQGASVKKKDETHRMAEANRAFAHFRMSST